MTLTPHARLAFVRDLYRQYPKQITRATSLILLSNIAEAVGLVALVPLLHQLIQSAPSNAPQGLVEEGVRTAFAALSVPYNLGTLLTFITLAMLTKGLFQWLAWRQAGTTVAQVVTDFRMRLVANLFRADWTYFTRNKIGSLANSLGHETLGASAAYLSACRFLAAGSLVLVYVLAVAFLSLYALLFVLVMSLALIAPVRGLLRYTRTIADEELHTQKAFVSNLTNTIASIRPIRAMGAHEEFEALAHAEAEKMRSAVARLTSSTYQMRVLQEPTLVVSIAIALLLGRSVLGLEIPTLMLVGFAMWRIGFHVNVANNSYREMLALEPAYWSLQEVIRSSAAASESHTGTLAPPSTPCTIEFRNVAFSYGEKAVFDDLNLTIAPRSITALVGESGAGKSTCIDLLLGLHQPESGSLLLNETALETICTRQWRRTLGYVPQETTLFYGSVVDNVRLGDSSIEPAAVKQALEDANAWVFVDALPQGMDTLVGEQGAQLSGGQRQRIAIARALVRKPTLLLLDEFTASLDAAAQAHAIELLKRLSRSMTIVVATHQAAVIEAADVVYRFNPSSVTREP